MPGVPRDTRRRIGLLGGSFNPAHDGHRHISLEALKRLGLDEVWWLVSPQNPLKSDDGMEPLATRVDEARELTHRRLGIEVADGALARQERPRRDVTERVPHVGVEDLPLPARGERQVATRVELSWATAPSTVVPMGGPSSTPIR